MADTLYDTDLVLWAERQADALRRLRAGERVNDLDWDALIEEVEGVGKSLLRGVEARLVRALEHLLKATAWPDTLDVKHWLHEVLIFLRDARRDWTPAMDRHIDLDELYADARQRVLNLEYGWTPGRLPERCPFSTADLLPRDKQQAIDPRALLAKLRAA